MLRLKLKFVLVRVRMRIKFTSVNMVNSSADPILIMSVATNAHLLCLSNARLLPSCSSKRFLSQTIWRNPSSVFYRCVLAHSEV